MKAATGTHSHAGATAHGPMHIPAMIKNDSPMPSRMLPIRACNWSSCTRRASRSARR